MGYNTRAGKSGYLQSGWKAMSGERSKNSKSVLTMAS